MGVLERAVDGLLTVVRLNDKVERLSEASKLQQRKVEELIERVIRLEAMLEIAMATQGRKALPKPTAKD